MKLLQAKKFQSFTRGVRSLEVDISSLHSLHSIINFIQFVFIFILVVEGLYTHNFFLSVHLFVYDVFVK